MTHLDIDRAARRIGLRAVTFARNGHGVGFIALLGPLQDGVVTGSIRGEPRDPRGPACGGSLTMPDLPRAYDAQRILRKALREVLAAEDEIPDLDAFVGRVMTASGGGANPTDARIIGRLLSPAVDSVPDLIVRLRDHGNSDDGVPPFNADSSLIAEAIIEIERLRARRAV